MIGEYFIISEAVGMSITGILVGLLISIILVLRKWHGAYALITGAFIGAILGGGSLHTTTSAMIAGIQNMAPAIIRVMTAGVLVGTLISTGAAVRIADSIIDTLGVKHIFVALGISSALLTGIGIFMDVAFITLAPIALSMAKKLKISKISVLLALGGGCKVGNFVSPNPPIIAVSESFGVSIPKVMAFNFIPGVFSLILAILIAKRYANIGALVTTEAPEIDHHHLPRLWASVIGPITAIILLIPSSVLPALDPLIALPIGGFVGLMAMGKIGEVASITRIGLERVSGVVVLLLGIGAFVGVISASDIARSNINFMHSMNISPIVIAPLSGIIFSSATGSATAGAIISSISFSEFLLQEGVPPLAGASLVSAGAVALDHTPHGSFFHISKDNLNLSLKERFRTYHWEILIGLSIPLFASIFHLIIN
ncbi:MAG: GntP family permease [Brevinema sp.]